MWFEFELSARLVSLDRLIVVLSLPTLFHVVLCYSLSPLNHVPVPLMSPEKIWTGIGSCLLLLSRPKPCFAYLGSNNCVTENPDTEQSSKIGDGKLTVELAETSAIDHLSCPGLTSGGNVGGGSMLLFIQTCIHLTSHTIKVYSPHTIASFHACVYDWI